MLLIGPREGHRRATSPAVPVALGALLLLGGLCHAIEPVLPPVEEILPDIDTLSAQVRVFVRGFRFEGNAVFSDEELAEVLEDYTDRELTSEEVHEARRQLTLHYVRNGYINSGAILPDQTVKEGIVVFQVVEGELSEIAISGNKRTKTEYIERRVVRGAVRPLDLIRLQENLEILRQNPLFERVQAELQPGTSPGQSRLELTVEEDPPFHVALEFDNVQNPSVGAERLDLLVWHRNLTGVGDLLDVKYGLTSMGISDMEFAGLDRFSIFYTRPINSYDTTVTLGYVRDDSLLIEDPFTDLDITSESKTYSVGLRHPFYRTQNTEFAMSLTAERRSNRTELLGRPFSFSPGAEDGESDVTAIRFAQEWTTRDENRAIAARSTFTFGLPILGATDHDNDLPDSDFIAWLGQVQFVQRLWDTANRLIFRLSAQLADDSLLSLEQFGIGGMDTVRGYRENQIVRDNGAVASLEMRIPLLHEAETRRPVVELAPFIDFGVGWDTHSPRREQDLGSAGLGLLVDLNERVDAQLYWGAAFTEFDQSEHDLQDSGIHFRIVVDLL